MAEAAAPVLHPASLGGDAIEIRDPSINVEEIMCRIRQSIAEKKRARLIRYDAFLAQGAEPLPLSDSSRNLADHLALLQMAGRMDLEGEPIVSHRPVAGFFITLAKRFSRFWIRKYTDGVLAKQNYFNSETVRLLTEMNRRIEALEAENERLRAEIESLRSK